MNWATPACRAASTSCSCPSWSTPPIESSGWRESVVDAVEITVDMPRHAASSDARSLRSPWTTPTPRLLSRCTLAGSEVLRTSARTDSPRLFSRVQISPPSRPVAPTTRITAPPGPGKRGGRQGYATAAECGWLEDFLAREHYRLDGVWRRIDRDRRRADDKIERSAL